MTEKRGLKDQPIESKNEETLGISEYADVLTEFIMKCDTPLTIALQGDWGSGKTSLMNLVRHELAGTDKNKSTYITIDFQTWQYSLFDQSSSSLALSLMTHFCDSLCEQTGLSDLAKKIKSLKKTFETIFKATVVSGAGIVGQGDAARDFFRIIQREGNENDEKSVAITQLKDRLQKLVDRVVNPKKGEKNHEKIVVFVDDLDRLQPVKAVEFLEALKVFLDLNDCVFVLAIDYSVVVRGLNTKFGITGDDETSASKGQNFFDKIIQVPFTMPTKRYKLEQFLLRTLDEIGVKLTNNEDNEEVELYKELVERSVGFNPRSMKRILNSLQVMILLEEKTRRRDSDLNSSTNHYNKKDFSRVMFGILCMLETYESIFEYLTNNVSVTALTRLPEDLKNEEMLLGVKKSLGRNRTENASDFCAAFISCIQLDDDKKISQLEVNHLGRLLELSTTINRGATIQEDHKFALDLKQALNLKYRSFVKSRKPKYDIFRKEEHNWVTLKLPHLKNTKLVMYGDSTIFQMGLESWSSDISHQLGEHICNKFGWELGTRDPDTKLGEGYDSYTYYWFLQISNDSAMSLEDFKTEVFARCDRLTYPVITLFNICKQFAEK